MGLIMKNGIAYGGGSGESVDITEEEYNNLLASGQVNPSITYYITDGELSGEDSFSGIIEVTQQEYDALSDEEKNNGAIYAITDAEDLAAKNMTYNGSVTELGNNVQDAIDNVNNKVDEQNKKIDDKYKVLYDGSAVYSGIINLDDSMENYDYFKVFHSTAAINEISDFSKLDEGYLSFITLTSQGYFRSYRYIVSKSSNTQLLISEPYKIDSNAVATTEGIVKIVGYKL